MPKKIVTIGDGFCLRSGPRLPDGQLHHYWFRDSEASYMAARLLMSFNSIDFIGLTYHLFHQSIEKGLKFLLAFKSESTGKAVNIEQTHNLDRLYKKVHFIPDECKDTLRKAIDLFLIGIDEKDDSHIVGKYLVNTAGGLAPSYDSVKHIDYAMKFFYDFYIANCNRPRSSIWNIIRMRNFGPILLWEIPDEHLIGGLLFRNNPFLNELRTVLRENPELEQNSTFIKFKALFPSFRDMYRYEHNGQ